MLNASKVSITDYLLDLLTGKELRSAEDAAECVERNSLLPSFIEYFSLLLNERNMSRNDLFRSINLERSAGHRIMSNSRSPGRNVLLRMALVMQLALPQTQQLLKISGRAPLYPRIRRDALLIYALSHKLSLAEIEEALVDLGERSLYEKF